MRPTSLHPTRRAVLASGLGAAATGLLATQTFGQPGVRDVNLTVGKAQVPLLGGTRSLTAMWAFDGQVPGPEIRARQGERLRVTVENRLDDETTVHWHGLRVPNAMDGVPHLTQKPIAPGQSFVYEFDLPDAGTYWYHPHHHSSEQVGRGLFGPLIVEEREPIAVDRDITWVLSDWRLTSDGQIAGGFDNFMDAGMSGRIGNTVTVNGRISETFPVRRGERIRLRLINSANARIFGLTFDGHDPLVIAYDGQPVEPHRPEGGLVILGPAMRADLVIDCTGAMGKRFTVTDSYYRGQANRMLDLVYEAAPLRDAPLGGPIVLPANTMPEPNLNSARIHNVTFGGGMMAGMRMGGGRGGANSVGRGSGSGAATGPGRGSGMGSMGGMGSGSGSGSGIGSGSGMMMHTAGIWTINGVSATGHIMNPMLTLPRGQSTVFAMANETAWDHPIHLHGHSFRVISRNGQPTRHRECQDTVLMAPRERVDIAFVADNPGNWMFHCHILEHMAAGMMGVIRVT